MPTRRWCFWDSAREPAARQRAGLRCKWGKRRAAAVLLFCSKQCWCQKKGTCVRSTSIEFSVTRLPPTTRHFFLFLVRSVCWGANWQPWNRVLGSFDGSGLHDNTNLKPPSYAALLTQSHILDILWCSMIQGPINLDQHRRVSTVSIHLSSSTWYAAAGQ